jgi:hypothetical protein
MKKLYHFVLAGTRQDDQFGQFSHRAPQADGGGRAAWQMASIEHRDQTAYGYEMRGKTSDCARRVIALMPIAVCRLLRSSTFDAGCSPFALRLSAGLWRFG